MKKNFLQAEWRKLAMANYGIDKKILEPYLPANTEIDLWEETCYLSLVGFMFLNTRIMGIKVPFHINFEEVNLRFYVRYLDAGQWKRGVVFLKEIVPKPALTFVANTLYDENYETMPMRHSWEMASDSLTACYQWKKQRWHSFSISVDKSQMPIGFGTEEAFITEHYWGYTKISPIQTGEYEVRHPRWEVYPTRHYEIDVDFGILYGMDFSFLNTEKPKSVFLAEGSAIQVMKGRKF